MVIWLSVIEVLIGPAMTIPQPDDSNSRSNAQSAADAPEIDRRKGSADRRNQELDRRNSDRVAQDLEPRRDPDRKDRRKN